MYAATLTAAIASPAMEVPIDSLSDLLKATQEGRAVPTVIGSSSMEALFKVRHKKFAVDITFTEDTCSTHLWATFISHYFLTT